ncbi:BppU family phage baseplate upper protein [Limosilactobacillus fermentum]|uniref:BppU family phage baseplate upper protein n=1 Tax=Limosilactobacillus fermentum TaxID=1613 RepID=UPI002570203A|nr:BppU family phage baseplate upper protein [Limosilactobacillus fermentum]WJD85321.1 BppU family phage baseplate upper protein [Limosilactobacillus fermentum]
MATQAQSQGRYAVVNTLLDTTDVTLIDSLSGRQGDNGRIVYFAIKDGNLPHNLDGQNVVLTAKDSAGKVKQISGVKDMISATGGLFSMLIPGEMYQSAGDIEEAYLSVQDGTGTVISSIPVTFTVLANNILFTANASKDYIDSVQQAVDEANSLISGLNDNIKAQQLAYETLQTSVKNLSAQIDSKQVAMLNVANHFTETATFDKGITANTISTPNPLTVDGTAINLPDMLQKLNDTMDKLSHAFDGNGIGPDTDFNNLDNGIHLLYVVQQTVAKGHNFPVLDNGKDNPNVSMYGLLFQVGNSKGMYPIAFQIYFDIGISTNPSIYMRQKSGISNGGWGDWSTWAVNK